MPKAAHKKLPKAPLVEVVFELRWHLQAGPAQQPVLQSDPGLLPLLDSFGAGIKKQGFAASKEMSHPLQTGAYGVVRRYFKEEAKPFPIIQIGAGIFASNSGTEYEWNKFKKQTLNGVKLLLETYPKLSFFSLRPAYFELRYIDIFGKSLLGKAALFHFTENATSLRFRLPKMLVDPKLFRGDAAGRFVFQRELKQWKGSMFTLDLSSARNEELKDDVVRMETKIFCLDTGVPALGKHAKFVADVSRWLDFAHDISSPFFKTFIVPEVMDKFAGG